MTTQHNWTTKQIAEWQRNIALNLPSLLNYDKETTEDLYDDLYDWAFKLYLADQNRLEPPPEKTGRIHYDRVLLAKWCHKALMGRDGEPALDGDTPAKLETWQAKAIALAFERRDLTSDQIAEMVGKTRQALYGDTDAGSALKARKKQKRASSTLRKGEKDQDGNIEAW